MIFMLNVTYKEKYMHSYKVFYVFIFFPDYLENIYSVQQWVCSWSEYRELLKTAFIEIQFIHHKTRTFKVYDSVGFSIFPVV